MDISKQVDISRAAQYAQERRNNETEAREELRDILPTKLFDSDLASKTAFNITTKVLFATLQHLDHPIEINAPVNQRQFPNQPAEFAQLRRDMESKVRDALKARIPHVYFDAEIMDRSDFNQTTKVILAVCRYLHDFKHKQLDTKAVINKKRPKNCSNDEPHPPSKKIKLQLPLPRTCGSGAKNSANCDDPTNVSCNTQKYNVLPPVEKPQLGEEIHQLRQVTERLLQKVEMTSAASVGISTELRSVINIASDFIIDVTSVIEQRGDKRELAGKWKAQQLEWSQEFVLQ